MCGCGYVCGGYGCDCGGDDGDCVVLWVYFVWCVIGLVIVVEFVVG